MRYSGFCRQVAAVLTAVLLAAVPAQAESFSAIVTADSMKVYADEGRTWQIGKLSGATVVTVEEHAGDTARISVNGKTGYAAVADMEKLEKMATPVKANTNTRVYRSADLDSRWLSVPKGTEINLLATKGRWAMVEKSGVVAYTNKDHLTTLEQDAETEQPEENPSSGEAIVKETFSAKVTASRMPVYMKATEGSQCLGSLKAGTVITVNAYKGGWAYIEYNGKKGYAKIAHMERAAAEAGKPEKDETGVSAEHYINDERYTTEQIIYLFLTQEMKLNTAVACGILANVERECSFNVTAASYDGGYGIVQWTGVRNTRLKDWCKANNYNYATLEGQLWYLKYELETHHPKTLKYLRTVENTPAGAYDAGHYFCYNFEIPASRAKRSVERGNIAKDKYWMRYSKL